MWKSGWKINIKWIREKERWLILLACGLVLLLLGSGEKNAVVQTSGISSAAQSSSAGSSEDVIGTDWLNVSRETDGKKDSMEAGSKDSESYEARKNASYEKLLEQRVKDILRHVDGVGQVEVMITLKTMGETIYHADQETSRNQTEEKDREGGLRTIISEEMKKTSQFSGGSGTQNPVIEKELQPEIEGILISAQGGGSASVKAEISEAMEALFGLPAHKIKVLKRAE